MKKKLGPLPLWAWIAILAVAGFTLYRYEKNKSESTGVEEGFMTICRERVRTGSEVLSFEF